MNSVQIAKSNKVVEIFKEAVDKRFTYITITTSLGFYSMSVLENLVFECEAAAGDKKLFVRGETMEVNEIVNIPLTSIDEIEDIEEGQFDLIGADAEYRITYHDGTELFIQIYDQDDN